MKVIEILGTIIVACFVGAITGYFADNVLVGTVVGGLIGVLIILKRS